MSIVDSMIEFASAVRADRAANPDIAGDGTTLELLLAPRFQTLLEAILPQLVAAPPNVLPEYRRRGVGRPDIAFAHHGSPARAFIELKQPETALIPEQFTGHNADQFERFCELPLWALCNFLSICLCRRNEHALSADILPAPTIDPTTHASAAARMIRNHDHTGFIDILRTLALAHPIVPTSAEEAAQVLAYAARLVRSVVAAQCREGLDGVVSEVRADFNQILFARAEAGGYDSRNTDALFSSAFAQTLIFGLLLAREAGGEDAGPYAYEQLADATHPLLRGTLRALTLDEVRAMLGAAFDVTVDAVNSIDSTLLTPIGERDPVLYLYEDFLRVFDPEAVKKYGVYYTPPEIVQLIVMEVARSLRERFDTEELLDSNVNLLDPACGTGTFLIAAASAAAERAASTYGRGAVAAEITAFAQRMHGFELLVGPYTVAHYRMAREIAGRGGSAGRLPIFLTDTLAPPANAAGLTPHLAFLSAPMVAERKAADSVKRDSPILVVMGNPPYKRLRAGEVAQLIGSDMNARWEDLKRPVQEAGYGRSMNAFPDLYVAFYRWALWRLFEAEGAQERGILAFITNRNFLTGRGFGGLRKMLRERFERIRVIDFRGDTRSARPATVERDENIFNIEVGVCVLIAEATHSATTVCEATVEYADVWHERAFGRTEKLDLARTLAADPERLSYVAVHGTRMDQFKPAGFCDTDWPSINELFAFRSNGIVTYRDAFSYAVTENKLRTRIINWLELDRYNAIIEFKETRDRKAGAAHRTSFDDSAIRQVSYRPFDIRFLYNKREFVDFPKQTLQDAWGERNVALFALDDGTGDGPAVWCHGLIPDQHAFRGSYGGWVFPLWARARASTGHRLNPALVSGLSRNYGTDVVPQQIFDATLAMLSASTYTTRFAYDLEDGFPHVPFPADYAVFEAAAALGMRIRAIQTFGESPAERFRTARLVGRASGPCLDVPVPRRAFVGDGSTGMLTLLADQSLRIASVSERAWQFSVSGYRVLIPLASRAQRGGSECAPATRTPGHDRANRGNPASVRRGRRHFGGNNTGPALARGYRYSGQRRRCRVGAGGQRCDKVICSRGTRESGFRKRRIWTTSAHA